MERYFNLLKQWCDGLISQQITQFKQKGLYGGILCPACALIHGRCMGLVHPFLYLAEKTGDNKYISAACRLIDWSDFMFDSDGGIRNDTICEWKGTTAFTSIAFTGAIRGYAELLEEPYRKKLDEKNRAALQFLCRTFDTGSGNINYLAGTACALEIGGKLYGIEEYRTAAEKCARKMMSYITDDGLIYGEGGHDWEHISPKGCRPIDIGYNVEESLNLLSEYAISSGDSAVLQKCLEMARSHADFLLPDGGWDNSFGTRMDKWTYWGSRTSDGCQPGYTMLSSFDRSLGYVARTNLAVLEKSTADGLLYGGLGLKRHHEPACVHHAFTHAEGLVCTLEWIEKHGQVSADFPKRNGTRYLPSMDTYLYNGNGWRGTITGYDEGEKEYCHPSGGALSLLYHKRAGILLVSSMSRFERYEIMNTQRHLYDCDHPFTMRLQVGGTPLAFSNILDKTAKLKQTEHNAFEASGRICGEKGENPAQGEIHFCTRYIFDQDTVELQFEHDGKDVDFVLPVVTETAEETECSNGFYFIKNGCKVSFDFGRLCVKRERIFNHVPGFEGGEFFVPCVPNCFSVRITVC